MEVITVLFMVILTAILLTICVVSVWPWPGDSPGAAGRRARGDKSPPADKSSHGSLPESLEGVLVRQLAVGEITRPQYLQAMSRLAERDAERHPLEVPRE
jgi:hypothetical protein